MEGTGQRTRSQQELLDAALSYAKRGWAVFPLHWPIKDEDGIVACSCNTPDCKSLGKHPRTRNGLKDATTDAEKIKKWWDTWPSANIGIATGSASGGLVVIDVDSKHNGIENWQHLTEEMKEFPIGDAPLSMTGGGGFHILFHCDDKVPNSASKVTMGVDVRGEGGYIVGPPSEHGSGRQYTWELSSHPDETSLGEMPGWLFERCVADQPAAKPQPVKASNPAIVTGVVSEGSRNETLFKIGRSLWAKECDDYDALFARLKEYNQTKCAPPLEEKEVETIAKSVTKKPSGTSKANKNKEAIALHDKVTREQHPDEEIKRPEGPLSFARGDHTELATRLLIDARGDSPVPIVFDRGEFWRYEAHLGLWQPIRRATLHKHVQRYAGAIVGDKTLKVNATEGVLDAASYQCDNPGYFDNAPFGLVFRNGFVDIGPDHNVRLTAHSPEHRARHGMNSDWNENLDAPLFRKFLGDIFTPEGLDVEGIEISDEDRKEIIEDRDNAVKLLGEFIGICLLGEATKYANALVLFGESASNGKSTVIKIIKRLFPEQSVTSVSPTQWDNRFYLAELATSRLNAVSEMPSAQIAANDVFKAVISGDDVTVARKFKDPFTMKPRAGHIFACNELPATIDQTEGFWRRFIVLKFDRTFVGKEADKTLADRIIANELGAIAVRSIIHAARLRKQGEFTLPKSSVTAKAVWKGESDPIRLWMMERTKKCNGKCGAQCEDRYSPNCSIRPDEAYVSFRDWCKETGNAIITKKSFLVGLKRIVGQRRDENFRWYPIYLYSR